MECNFIGYGQNSELLFREREIREDSDFEFSEKNGIFALAPPNFI